MQVLRRHINLLFQLKLTRLLISAMLVLTICRIIWLGGNISRLNFTSNYELVHSMVVGIYFDLPVLAYLYSPVWFALLFFPKNTFQHTSIIRILFTISSAICIILNSIDAAYSNVTSKRSGMELWTMLGDEGNKLSNYIYDYWFFVLLILGLLFLIYKLVPVKGDTLYIYDKTQLPQIAFKLVLISGFWILAARGGLQLKPIRSLDAGKYSSPDMIQLVVSTPLQMMSTIESEPLPEIRFMSDATAENLVLDKKIKGNGNKKNVILIIVESLGRDYTGFLNRKPYTPFLDSLSKKCINFRFCYANGTRSIEMVPSIFCGMPNLMSEHYINSAYSTNKVKNLFKQFEENGYTTSFFHGGANGTMGFSSFLLSTGLQRYLGLNEYPDKQKHHDGHWGIFDEPYLQYINRYLDTITKPFFTSVFTLSSHHPYHLPEEYKNKFAEGKLPIHRSIRYTDYALKKFFETAEKRDWFENTVFIITGDHTSYGEDDYFYSQSGHYEIPLLIYGTGIQPATIDKTVSQCDIGPIAAYLSGVQLKGFGMGRNPFSKEYEGYSFHYDNHLYYAVKYPYVMGIDEKGAVKAFYRQLRNDKKGTPLNKNHVEYEKMLEYLKATVQVYNQRIKYNKWQ